MARKPSRIGSALVVTLAMLVLISILVVGFVATARLDVVSAQLHLNGIQADIYAQMGEEAALAKLKAATLSSSRIWISQPGAVVVSSGGATQVLTNVIDLSSGWSSSANATNDQAADFNPALLGNTNSRLLAPRTLFGTNTPEMRARWIYVRSDGTFDTNASPAYDAANPIRGRFAYWVDDESARIDANTALIKAAANSSLSHPSRVDLGNLLTNADITAISQYRASQFFNSPEELKRVSTNVAATASSNSFSFTHYSHAPELNMFGEQRILLTTQKSVAENIYGAGTTNYLDILASPDIDPGNRDTNTINYTKLKQAMNRITQLLARTNWPILPNKTFAAKYAPLGNTARTAQLSLDIVEYVRSRESTNECVQPIRVDSSFSPTSGSGDYGQGFTRRPLVSEVGIWYGTDPSQGSYFKIEVYLPPGAGQIDLTKEVLIVQAVKGTTGNVPLMIGASAAGIPIGAGPPPTSPTAADDSKVYLDSADPYIRGGGYRVITAYRIPWVGGSTRPGIMSVRVGVGDDLAPVNQGLGYNISYTVDPTNIPFSGITSAAVADPVVNKHHADWVQGPSTFGTNNNTPSPGVNWGPLQDMDASGTIYRAGAVMAAPKGQAGNLSGRVESVAELGYLPTGIEGYITNGIPWRTLHLQPEAGADIPDWALLDLFAAPIVTSASEKPVIYPHTNGSVGGRINLNSTILPFKDSADNPRLARLDGLKALVKGVQDATGVALPDSQAATIAGNIALRNPATGIRAGRAFGNTNIYYSPWQIAEIAGVADAGEESETILRQIGSLATVRSSVFALYSVGQAVQQNKNGKISVLSERRGQEMVERANKTLPGNTSLSYETVYSRELQP